MIKVSKVCTFSWFDVELVTQIQILNLRMDLELKKLVDVPYLPSEFLSLSFLYKGDFLWKQQVII